MKEPCLPALIEGRVAQDIQVEAHNEEGIERFGLGREGHGGLKRRQRCRGLLLQVVARFRVSCRA
jgi:hypothetical protein